MKQQGGSEAARRHQRLVIGPWAHGPLAGWYPEQSFGVLSGTDAADLTGLQLAVVRLAAEGRRQRVGGREAGPIVRHGHQRVA